jgi:hypothetical protein
MRECASPPEVESMHAIGVAHVQLTERGRMVPGLPEQPRVTISG